MLIDLFRSLKLLPYGRPERSLSMRLYTLDKRSFVLVFLAFFACFALGIFIGLAGPEITELKEIDAASLSNNASDFLSNGPFVIQSTLLGSYSRQLWLFAKYKIENTENEIFDTTFDVNVEIQGLENERLVTMEGFAARNRSRHLKCVGNNCEEFTILHLGWLEFSHYKFVIKFYGLNLIHKRYNISKLTFFVSRLSLWNV